MAMMEQPEASGRAGELDVTLGELKQFPTLRHLREEELSLLRGATRVTLALGDHLPTQIGGRYSFYAVLEGEVTISRQEGGREEHVSTQRTGDTFGEVPLLSGWRAVRATCLATKPTRLLRVPEDAFWKILGVSPATREAVLADYTKRFETYQAMTLHREKLVSLGTLAAGLMHELNNPGAAAKRAASQLRENVSRLQQISLRMTRTPLDSDQLACLAHLQEQVLVSHGSASPALSPLEQSDQEEELSSWLESIGVDNPWRLAPTLVSAGWVREDIACARESFPPRILSDALNYLEALISSMQFVGTIEESVARVTDLVVAVKKYAYDDKNRQQAVDVRDSLLSTLTILSHKFRQKSIQVERELPPAATKISCVGAGLAQVWTNLLDNAIDASPENGTIRVRLWTENNSICVGIRDSGPGIPPEHAGHIFEPFYTTKEAGVGTGLGLDIAHRIVVGNFHGDLEFTSKLGATEFVVRLPIADVGDAVREGCSIAAR